MHGTATEVDGITPANRTVWINYSPEEGDQGVIIVRRFEEMLAIGVEVRHETVDGQDLGSEMVLEDNTQAGTPYDTTGKRYETVKANGKTYRLITQKIDGVSSEIDPAIKKPALEDSEYYYTDIEKDSTGGINPSGNLTSQEQNGRVYMRFGRRMALTYLYEEVPDEKLNANIVYIDDSTNKTLHTDEVEGKPGEKIPYSTQTKITDLEKQGYKLVKDGFNPEDSFNSENQTYEVHVMPRIEPVTPSNPIPEPGDPVDPDNPESPVWPEKVDQISLTKEVKRTIHYRYEDQTEAAPDKKEVVKFEREAKVNLVTGEITYEDWKSKNTTFDAVKTPVIEGYLADKEEVGQVTGITPESKDLEETVIFKKIFL